MLFKRLTIFSICLFDCLGSKKKMKVFLKKMANSGLKYGNSKYFGKLSFSCSTYTYILKLVTYILTLLTLDLMYKI